MHHFGRVCLKRAPTTGCSQGKSFKVQYAHNSPHDESYDVFQVSPKQVERDITVNIEGAPVQVCIDSLLIIQRKCIKQSERSL